MQKKVIIILCFSLILLTCLFPIKANATTIDPNSYDPRPSFNIEDVEPLTNKFGVIIDVIKTFGTIATVIWLLILGIKYMVGSVTERADYKKSMIPYIIGVVIFFSLTQILGIIIGIAGNI